MLTFEIHSTSAGDFFPTEMIPYYLTLFTWSNLLRAKFMAL